MSNRAFVSLLLAATCTLTSSPGRAEDFSVASSVVRLDVVTDPPNLLAPWQTEGISENGGSGVIIEGHRILTNAHVVESAVAIEVKRADGSASYPARVAFISHDADLALVEVENRRFFDGARAIPIGEMPRLQQAVKVYGFPVGGNTLSITSGIVSRIEVEEYSQSYRELLMVQIDAAINPGNSGGPVMTNGSLAGIAVETMHQADNVGYMVPSPVVAHFLEDVADGRYDGYPDLGITVQGMANAAQRRGSRMAKSDTGVLVLRVDYGGPSHGVLRPRDVILKIDGHAIANDRTVAWENIGRVGMEVSYQSKQIGETVDLVILRDGRRLKKRIVLTTHRPLVPGRRSTEWPRYVQFAGLVFQPLTEKLIDDAEAGYSDAVSYAETHNLVTKARREIILLGEVLPHPVNRGYQKLGHEIVRLVNGVMPRDLSHLAKLIDSAKGPFFRVVVESGHVITLDLAAARRANPDILFDYGIDYDRYLGPTQSGSQRRPRR